MEQRKDAIMAWQAEHPQDSFPVFIVSAEGGGSRAAYWTAINHAHLQKENRNYYHNHLFALTGASGGTTGNSTFFSLKEGNLEGADILDMADDIFRQNYLSSSLVMLMGFDLWKDIFGLNIGNDRAKELEREWTEEMDRL
ncbi:MAG: hypothetical protein KDD63_25670 [Bacteroidetes bacterium]|nr:hypothetical protein [Bacteroidota bacterium]